MTARRRQLWPPLLRSMYGTLARQRATGRVPRLQNAGGQACSGQKNGRGMVVSKADLRYDEKRIAAPSSAQVAVMTAVQLFPSR